MNAYQYLEDLFVKFQRLNQILKDNWDDATQQSFDGNYLNPIATEWSMYHSSVIDINARLKVAKNEIEDSLTELHKQVEKIRLMDECSLNGDGIYIIKWRSNGYAGSANFIIPKSEMGHMDEDDLIFLAEHRFPSKEELYDPSLEDTILIR